VNIRKRRKKAWSRWKAQGRRLNRGLEAGEATERQRVLASEWIEKRFGKGSE